MIKKLGIPYKGSKRAIADKIVNYILEHNPDTKYIYDLFGGGGAMSFEFLQRPQIEKVFYNELNTGVCELLKDIKKNGVSEKYYQWIDKKTFDKHKNDSDWFGGLCKCIWSFGNNQVDYLFGKDIEEYKHNFHLAVVNNIDTTHAMSDFCMKYVLNKYGVVHNLKLAMPIKKRYKERKLEIRGQLNVFEKHCKVSQLKQLEKLEKLQQLEQLEKLQPLQRLHQLQQLEQLQRLEKLQQLEKLQPLERLERLQQLQPLERLERLEILNLSYDGVIVTTPIRETIIYLDPPYANCKTDGKKHYQHTIDFEKLHDFFKNSPYKIYLSGYDEPYKSVLDMQKRCTFSQTTNSSVTEKLYCNRRSNDK